MEMRSMGISLRLLSMQLLVTMMMVFTVLVTMVMVIMWAFLSIMDYSLAHEVGRVRLQL